jgi:hypothetical protein
MEMNKTKIGEIAERKLAEVRAKILNCTEVELAKLKRFENYWYNYTDKGHAEYMAKFKEIINQ